MTTKWMSGAHKVDLSRSRGNGPFGRFLGVALHVNVDEHGTGDSYWRNNPGQVTPNFQVFKSLAEGGVHQMLPFNWQPWCQVNGNFNYAAIETAGEPHELMTDYQLHAIASILRIYHHDYGMQLRVTNTPGQHGFITHAAGGASWGGHSCPGPGPRAGQRVHILSLAAGSTPAPAPHPTPTGKHLRNAWPSYMGPDDYFGLLSGGVHSRGGATPEERKAVLAIKLRLRQIGYTGFDDNGYFGEGTKTAVTKWQKKVAAHSTDHFGCIYHDDWNRLFTY